MPSHSEIGDVNPVAVTADAFAIVWIVDCCDHAFDETAFCDRYARGAMDYVRFAASKPGQS